MHYFESKGRILNIKKFVIFKNLFCTAKSLSEALIFCINKPTLWRQIAHWITSSIHENSKLKLRENMLCTEIVSDIQNNFCTQHVLPMFCKKERFWQSFTCTSLFSQEKEIYPVPSKVPLTYLKGERKCLSYYSLFPLLTIHHRTSSVTWTISKTFRWKYKFCLFACDGTLKEIILRFPSS